MHGEKVSNQICFIYYKNINFFLYSRSMSIYIYTPNNNNNNIRKKNYKTYIKIQFNLKIETK